MLEITEKQKIKQVASFSYGRMLSSDRYIVGRYLAKRDAGVSLALKMHALTCADR